MDLLAQNGWMCISKYHRFFGRFVSLLLLFGISRLFIPNPGINMIYINLSILLFFFLLVFLVSRTGGSLFRMSDIIPAFLFPKDIVVDQDFIKVEGSSVEILNSNIKDVTLIFSRGVNGSLPSHCFRITFYNRTIYGNKIYIAIGYKDDLQRMTDGTGAIKLKVESEFLNKLIEAWNKAHKT